VNDRNSQYQDRRAEQEQRALTVVEPLRMPLPDIARRDHGLDESKWRALTESVFPSATSVTGVLMALDYCNARGLDVFKRPVHVVPMWNSKLGRNVETVWPGIGELRTTAARTMTYAGADECEFGKPRKQAFSERKSIPGRGRNQDPKVIEASCPEFEFPDWAQFTVYKIVAGVRCKFVGPKVRFDETFSGEKGLRVPNTRWRQAPYQMLEKCAEAAALRRAFPEELAGSYTSDEMEGKVANSTVPQADYVDADANDGRGQGEQLRREEPQAQDDQSNDDDHGGGEADDGWDERDLLDYMGGMRRTLKSVKSIERLEQILKHEEGRMKTLPTEQRDEAQRLEDEARTRIEAAAAGAEMSRQHPEAGDDGADDQQQAGQEPVQAAEDHPEDPYIADFRAKVAKIEMIVDLTKFEGETMDELEEKPPFIANVCRRILQQRRDALKPAK